MRAWILILIAIALAAATPAAAADPRVARGDALDRALAAGRISPPQYALERARSLFALAAVRAKYGDVAKPGPREATLILRDLAVALPKLSVHGQRSAEALLARPTDGSADPDGYTVARKYFRHLCTTRFCIHWVTRSSDAPSLADRNPRNRVPDWIDETKAVMNRVWRSEIVELGYRRPKRDPYDGHRGGNPNGKLDIFIADVGRNSLYGYCAIDDPAAGKPTVYRVAAFCVFDNDYSRGQFGGAATGVSALKVTGAHEVHHAEQFKYDFREDRWFMEATATNMEAAVYPSIHDNYQYFSTSPLSPIDPSRPIDEYSPASSNQYGSWIFFRFLSEYFSPRRPASTIDHRIPHDIWELAADTDTSNGGLYSTQAVKAALVGHIPSASFSDAFRDFGVANARPAAWYRNGAGYPTAGAQSFALEPGVWTFSTSAAHMSNRYVKLRPDGAAGKLTIAVDLPDGVRGLSVTALIFRKDGTVTEHALVLDGANDGRSPALDFSSATVNKVIVVVTNASTRFASCGTDNVPPLYSCRGRPEDDLRAGEYLTFEVS